MKLITVNELSGAAVPLVRRRKFSIYCLGSEGRRSERKKGKFYLKTSYHATTQARKNQ